MSIIAAYQQNINNAMIRELFFPQAVAASKSAEKAGERSMNSYVYKGLNLQNTSQGAKFSREGQTE
eukprot:scaffold3927_cov179-Skeletonema_marinoi.AAC.5